VVFLLAGLGALVVALVVTGVVGFDLFGRIRRLQRTARTAADDLRPRVRALIPESGPGRHRAPDGR
jgi:hypothetical protein